MAAKTTTAKKEPSPAKASGKKKSAAKAKAPDHEVQAQEILEKAKKLGLEDNFMFVTTFKRYMELIARLDELQEAIVTHKTMVTKEYVKGRGNLYVNPAVSAYNQTAGAADKTAQLLMKYMTASNGGDEGGDSFDLF